MYLVFMQQCVEDRGQEETHEPEDDSIDAENQHVVESLWRVTQSQPENISLYLCMRGVDIPLTRMHQTE